MTRATSKDIRVGLEIALRKAVAAAEDTIKRHLQKEEQRLSKSATKKKGRIKKCGDVKVADLRKDEKCKGCGGCLCHIGDVGNRSHYLCRDCGVGYSRPIESKAKLPKAGKDVTPNKSDADLQKDAIDVAMGLGGRKPMSPPKGLPGMTPPRGVTERQETASSLDWLRRRGKAVAAGGKGPVVAPPVMKSRAGNAGGGAPAAPSPPKTPTPSATSPKPTGDGPKMQAPKALKTSTGGLDKTTAAEADREIRGFKSIASNPTAMPKFPGMSAPPTSAKQADREIRGFKSIASNPIAIPKFPGFKGKE